MKTLAEYREAAGLSQATVARRMGKLRGWVAHAEQGRIAVTEGDLRAYFAALELGRIERKQVEHETFRCPMCGKDVLDDPPGTGLFLPLCGCSVWKQASVPAIEPRG